MAGGEPHKRRGGRAGHVAPKRTAFGKIRRKIPPYQLLDSSALDAIEIQADWILERIGMEFHGDDVALELFRAAGADVDGVSVKFEPGLVRSLCATAPRQFDLVARDPVNTITLGGDYLVLMPGYGSPFVTDLDRGRRYATLDDFHKFIKLTQMSPYLQHSGGTVVEPTDVPVNKRHLDMVYAHLTLSNKLFMGAVTGAVNAQDSIDMARLVFGDMMDNCAVMQGNINVNSPLVFDGVMTGALRAYAKAGQCVCISPAIFGGAMGPVTQVDVIAQTHAEAMVGIALTQLVRRGCPVVYGSFHSTMSLKSGALTFGSAEASLTTMALAQMARRLGVPVRSGGGQITSSNCADGQAMAESNSAMWSTIMSGTHQVWHAAGWLEGGLVMSYEKFAMDLDQCGAMLRMVQGIETSEFAKDAYRETGPGQNFLATTHTLEHFRDANFQPDIAECGPYETWAEAGEQTLDQRANTRWKSVLGRYQRPEIDASVDTALLDFMAQRRAREEDMWY